MIVYCESEAKYFYNNINDFRLNKSGKSIDLEPQDDGYRCKSVHISDIGISMSIIGSKNRIKYFKVTK